MVVAVGRARCRITVTTDNEWVFNNTTLLLQGKVPASDWEHFDFWGELGTYIKDRARPFLHGMRA
eukprot:55698-Alexandrium_andersonii.AAC.1